jgi:hypothetical protein
LIIVTLSGEGESVNDDTCLNGSDKTSLPSWGAGWNQWQKGARCGEGLRPLRISHMARGHGSP